MLIQVELNWEINSSVGRGEEGRASESRGTEDRYASVNCLAVEEDIVREYEAGSFGVGSE